MCILAAVSAQMAAILFHRQLLGTPFQILGLAFEKQLSAPSTILRPP